MSLSGYLRRRNKNKMSIKTPLQTPIHSSPFNPHVVSHTANPMSHTQTGLGDHSEPILLLIHPKGFIYDMEHSIAGQNPTWKSRPKFISQSEQDPRDPYTQTVLPVGLSQGAKYQLLQNHKGHKPIAPPMGPHQIKHMVKCTISSRGTPIGSTVPPCITI